MTRPALVIFDMAGTTVEDRGQVPSAFAATLAAHNLPITADDITRVRGASKRQAVYDLLRRANANTDEASGRSGGCPDEASARSGACPDEASARRGACPDEASARSRADRIYGEFRKLLTDAYRNGGARCVPGADTTIQRLRADGIKVALTTGFDRDIATLLLSTIGWTPRHIDAIVCGEDVANGRPAPDMILMAMTLTGIADPARVANVGDTTLDLESASRAGVKWNIGVLTGAHKREALETAPHTEIIESVASLRF